MEDLLRLAIDKGIWAVLFVYLLFYVLKANNAREERLIKNNEKLADKLGVIVEVKDTVTDVKGTVDRVERRLEKISEVRQP